MEKKSSKVSGAGFLIFKKDTLGSKTPMMLALVRDDGLLDIPKGTIDSGEDSLTAAKRECFEECSIVINDEDILFSGNSHVNGQLEVFSAVTDQEPLITVNPHSGILEHVDFLWTTEHDFCSRCLPYLIPATNHFYSSH